MRTGSQAYMSVRLKEHLWQHVKTPTEIKMRRSPTSSELIYGCVWNLASVRWQSTEYLHLNNIFLLVNGDAAKTSVRQEVCGFCLHHLPEQNNSSWYKVDPQTWIKIRLDVRCPLELLVQSALHKRNWRGGGFHRGLQRNQEAHFIVQRECCTCGKSWSAVLQARVTSVTHLVVKVRPESSFSNGINGIAWLRVVRNSLEV